MVLSLTASPELNTHIHYLEYMNNGTYNVSFQYKNRVARNSAISRSAFSSRVKLAVLTYQSLNEEMDKVNQTYEYARVCSAWVAIKGYYLLYYLESMIMSLIEADTERLKTSHKGIRSFIKAQFSVGAITCSSEEIAKIVKHVDCLDAHLPKGANLRTNLHNGDRYNQLMKKLTIYAKDEFKRSKNLKQLRGADKITFMNQTIGLIDFFYWYRIKSNYRDLEFIAGEQSSTQDLFYFYQGYNSTSLNVARAYIVLINELYAKRTGDSQELFDT